MFRANMAVLREGRRKVLNAADILQKMEPYLNAERELSEFEFVELFASGEQPLTLREQYEVIRIMIAAGIDYVDEKAEEARALDAAGLARPPADQGDEEEGLLSAPNERLCALAQGGDRAALAALIEKNERFIYQQALKTQQRFAQSSLTNSDLFQEGALGLMEALGHFDASKGYVFLTYAWSWV
ncbi:MAG: hypothetical protein LBU47_08240, partial [Christensenellaceae bacterium]|nr:hypothetical protein [Christensenellaceae bacterium]